MALWLLLALPGAGFSQAASGKKIFDGRPKKLYYTYNSHGGGGGIAGKLNRYLNNKSYITVQNINAWGTGLDEQNKVVAGTAGGGTWLSRVDYAQEPNDVIFIALSGSDAQIKDSLDHAGIQKGVAKVRAMLNILRQKGVDFAFASTYHYHTYFGFEHAMDDSHIFDALAKTADSLSAINSVTLMKKHYPLTVNTDAYHPSGAGGKLWDHIWFAALLKHDGLPVPDWSLEEAMTAIRREDSLRNAIRLQTDLKGRTFRVGDTVQISYAADCALTGTVHVSLVTDHTYFWLDSLPCKDPRWGRFTWTIPAQAIPIDNWSGPEWAKRMDILKWGNPVKGTARIRLYAKGYKNSFATWDQNFFSIYAKDAALAVEPPRSATRAHRALNPLVSGWPQKGRVRFEGVDGLGRNAGAAGPSSRKRAD